MEVMAERPGDYLGIDEEFMSPDGFSQRRKAKLQRSQDSGAVTDWSRNSPSRRSGGSSGSSSGDEKVKFVTVLSVNGGLILDPSPTPPIQLDEEGSPSVTVIPIMQNTGGICLSSSGFMEEVACIVRRPGQKLGFGLKFDGGTETDRPVQRLFIQCCAEFSPAASVRCSWGRLVEADQIIQIDGEDIRTLTRLQVVRKLTEGPDVLSLKIRHYWDEKERANIVQQLGSSTPIAIQPASTKIIKTAALQQERAVDVPEEFLLATAPPVAPPRRRRRTNKEYSVLGRSLSSDEVLVNGQRISVPSKPPRIVRSSRSFNSKKSVAELADQSSGASTLPRSCQKEPHRHRSILSVNHDETPLIPPAAEVYVNLIAEEDQRAAAAAESSAESDTCSSVSTVVGWSEVNEYREEIKVEPQQQFVPPPAPEDLPILIQPPATFLDENPSDDGNKQQDASSDSGASSGGSELQLVDVDSDCEELKAFQQVENAIYQSQEELAVVEVEEKVPAPTCAVTSRAPPTTSSTTKTTTTTPKGAIKAPVVKTNSNNSTLGSKLKTMDNNNKATTPSRLPVNRGTPIRSRIPQAVTAISPITKPTAAAKPSNARPTVNNRPSSTVVASSTKAGRTTHRPSDVIISNKAALNNNNNKMSSSSSVKSGLVQSRIPRPSSSTKISPTVGRLASAKSSNRLHLTHNKGESDLVSAH